MVLFFSSLEMTDKDSVQLAQSESSKIAMTKRHDCMEHVDEMLRVLYTSTGLARAFPLLISHRGGTRPFKADLVVFCRIEKLN